MTFEGDEFPTGFDIPQPSRMVVAAGYEDFVVRCERHSGNVGGVPREGCLLFVFHRFAGRLISELKDLLAIPHLAQSFHSRGPPPPPTPGKPPPPPPRPPPL